MQFKNPEILYLLFLLIIPILIHLFQLQRFKKVAFTNVKLLKQIEQQTRKSSKLKKLLILLSRLLLLASLIIAFAQPYYSDNTTYNKVETIIYLDNSLSMQAKGEKGELLQKAKHDLIASLQSTKNSITLITNNNITKNIELTSLKNEILAIDYYPQKRDIKTILLQIDNIKAGKRNTKHDIVLISDFQTINGNLNTLTLDSVDYFNFVQMQPKKAENKSIDSIWIDDQNFENINLKAIVKSYNYEIKNLSISLFLEDILYGKTSISLGKNNFEEIEFSIPNSKEITGKLALNDNLLLFDNNFYFTINKKEKINVLDIGESNLFLSKIYTSDEFNFISSELNQFDYNLISNQNLIVLNGIESFPDPLINKLQIFVSEGGNLVIIPSKEISVSSYNNLFSSLNIGRINEINESEKMVTTINFSHPFFKNVFKKEIDNFQYPSVSLSYDAKLKNSSSILKFNDQNDFISQININDSKIYWLSSPLTTDISNFTSSPLIVPIFYNFSIQFGNKEPMYFTVGNNNVFMIKSNNIQDDVLHISNENNDFIPLQKKSVNSVIIQTDIDPLSDGIYQVSNTNGFEKNIAFNFNRNESRLEYLPLSSIEKKYGNASYYTSISDAIIRLNDKYKKHILWQLFIIFALLFLGIEFLLQKFLKN